MANIKRGKQVFAEINITPLTDVCLVLLIIFMVTATFLTQGSGLNVDLPRASAAKALPAHRLEVTVLRDGRMYLDGSEVPQRNLAPTLAVALQQTSLKSVIIKADAEVPYRHVAAAMDAASMIGAEITLAAEQQAGGG
jgi:biopolymer transport protein ExbD